MSLNEIYNLLEWINVEPETREFRSGVVLLAALETGPHILRIHKFAGVPLQSVQDTSYFLRTNSLWVGKRFPSIHYGVWIDHLANDPSEESDNGKIQVGLALDVLIADGQVRREGEFPNYIYTVTGGRSARQKKFQRS